MTSELRVGVVGFGWMGQVHARAFSRLLQHYPDAGLRPVLVAVADPATDARLDAAVSAYGFSDTHTDWRDLVARDDIDVVSVTGPNFVHRDVGVAVARAGKHLWIEKPAGRGLVETEEIASAVALAGVQSAVGFNYRNAPAVEHARTLVADGRLGRIQHVAVRMLADYSAHPDGALSWRFVNATAGSGVLGDLVSHGVDLARYVVGDLVSLVADQTTFITERPQASASASHFSRGGDGPLGAVENEDHVSALLRFAGGAHGILESSRTAIGEQCTYGLEIHGDRGALSWDFRRMGELRLCLDQDHQDAAFRTHFVAAGWGELSAFQPGSGIAMGYDDLKVIEAQRLVRSIVTGQPQGATLSDAVVAAASVDAMARSARERRWVDLAPGVPL